MNYKKSALALIVLILTGCAASPPPPPPEPIGDLTPINPPIVYRSDLKS